MKQTIALLTLAVAAVAWSHVTTSSEEGRDVVFDQTGLSVVNGKAAQNFEAANDGHDCEAADDFEVTGPDFWVVEQVELLGRYSANGGPAATATIKVLTDVGGPGATVCTRTGTVVQDVDGDLTVSLATGCELSPGRYWLAVQADLSFTAAGQWYWDSSGHVVGSTAVWRDPGGTFPTFCTGWATLPDCFGTAEFSFLFAIHGSASPSIFRDGFESGNTGAWSVTAS